MPYRSELIRLCVSVDAGRISIAESKTKGSVHAIRVGSCPRIVWHLFGGASGVGVLVGHRFGRSHRHRTMYGAVSGQNVLPMSASLGTWSGGRWGRGGGSATGGAARRLGQSTSGQYSDLVGRSARLWVSSSSSAGVRFGVAAHGTRFAAPQSNLIAQLRHGRVCRWRGIMGAGARGVRTGKLTVRTRECRVGVGCGMGGESGRVVRGSAERP